MQKTKQVEKKMTAKQAETKLTKLQLRDQMEQMDLAMPKVPTDIRYEQAYLIHAPAVDTRI